MTPTILSRSLLIAATLAATTVTGAAQYNWVQLDDLGIKFQIHKKLDSIPLKLGEDPLSFHLRGRYEPTRDADFVIQGRYKYAWGLQVLEFDQSSADKKPATGAGDRKPVSKEDAEKAARAEYLERFRAANFFKFATEKDPDNRDRTFLVKGEEEKGRRGMPDWTSWHYSDKRQTESIRGTGTQDFYYFRRAAVFLFDSREVALVFTYPVLRGDKPDKKYEKIADKIFSSVRPLREKEMGASFAVNDEKNEFANSPERQKALAKALENITNVDGWDYFTSESYICLYSWDAGKDDKRKKSLDFAETIVEQMEEVQELYQEEFPPHEGMAAYWPTLRVCHNKDLFETYGDTPGGVVGWFNPGSKELVIFYDQDGVYGGKKGTKETAFHEGWHQYADAYFGGALLHRWFDEGHGDYFGGFTKKGRSWSYEPAKDRMSGASDIRQQIARKNFVPLSEIVTWNTDKFYGAKAVWYYAQGWAMIDFFRRGEERLGSKWNERWSDVLSIYTDTMLQTRSQKKAVEAAFDGVDWKELEEAWVSYVDDHIHKK